ncbi:hypothetical protein M9458_056779, partial [Cirrhinus mrigala]
MELVLCMTELACRTEPPARSLDTEAVRAPWERLQVTPAGYINFCCIVFPYLGEPRLRR